MGAGETLYLYLKLNDMSNTKHTPGPWLIHPYVEDGIDIFNQTGTIHIAAIKSEANAKLIAAAPDLLEALEQCLTRIDEKSKDTWDLKAIYVAKAAIKKATE